MTENRKRFVLDAIEGLYKVRASDIQEAKETLCDMAIEMDKMNEIIIRKK